MYMLQRTLSFLSSHLCSAQLVFRAVTDLSVVILIYMVPMSAGLGNYFSCNFYFLN